MRRGFLLAAVMLIGLAGCVDRAADAPETMEAAPAGDDAAPAGPEPTAEAAAPDDATPPADLVVPIALDGTIGTSAALCVLGPVGECAFAPVSEGASGVVLEGQTGRVSGGELVLTWSASSPLTSELTAGFMLMQGGEGCEGVDLGSARGVSPLTLTIAPAARALCPGELVHLWVAGTTWGGQDPVYYQVDVDQAFRVEGSFTLAQPAP